MSYHYGNKFSLTIFGESHQKAVGAVIEGLPAGESYPEKDVLAELAKRAPGQPGTTSRMEKDQPEILCGLFNQRFTGSALSVCFPNQNTRSEDYPLMYRPSHSDYPAAVRYQGYNDFRGGGQFSGRLTLPLVFAGAIAQSLLSSCHIHIGTHLTQVGTLQYPRYSSFTKAALSDEQIPEAIYDYLSSLNGDSVGAKIECAVLGLPCGIGEPWFDSMESRLSHLLFSVPGLKGVLFGDALDMPASRGSQMNDCYVKEAGVLKTITNHNGGILGGLSTGMPIVFETIFKPTPSIALKQSTYDPILDRQADLVIKGRHDPCIGIRALPVVKACAAIVIYDLLLEKYGSYETMKENLHE